MSGVIVPSLTLETEEEYKASIERYGAFTKHVHVDISDGDFAPVFLVAPEKLWWPRDFVVDIHAMVKHPSEYMDRLISLKPRLIVFHAETDEDIMPFITNIKRFGIKAGVALLKTTVPSTIADIIKAVDHVLIFSGDLGHYGGVASLMQLEKIRLVKAINPKVEIGWDGGISVDNAFTLSQGGVTVFNIGGAIAKAENPANVYAKLVKEVNKQGVI
jgi:ribulose-phosphate 3-epimerase